MEFDEVRMLNRIEEDYVIFKPLSREFGKFFSSAGTVTLQIHVLN